MKVEAVKKKVDETLDKLKFYCYRILDDYDYTMNDDDEPYIGEEDIICSLNDIYPYKYAPYLNDEEKKALWILMKDVIEVVPGYVWEKDPDDIENDPRWEDQNVRCRNYVI